MSYFIAGGKLEGYCQSYLSRETDYQLLDLLVKREYVCILSSRQMGKSSLIQRMIDGIPKHLAAKSCYFDLSVDSMTVETIFYLNLLKKIYGKFEIEFNQDKFRSKTKISPPHALFQEYLIELPLNSESVLIIFFDEIDSLFREQVKKEFSINFFSTIRSLYNMRGSVVSLGNLVFCLSGVLPPSNLLNDPTSTPFNIGALIRLKNIDYEKIISYEKGFKDFNGDILRLIESIFFWTNGHPYLTQLLCKIIDEYGNEEKIHNTDIFVNRIVNEHILISNDSIDNNTHFSNIQLYITSDKRLSMRAIDLYNRIWFGAKIIDDSLKETHEFLKNSGLIIEVDKVLTVANKIYQNYFNDIWIEKMIKIINRPFHDQLLYWIKENKNPEAANLKGELLKDCITWSKKVDNITKNEVQFLDQCRANEKIRKHKRNIAIISLLACFLVLSVGFFFQSSEQHKIEKEVLEQKNDDLLNDHISYLRLLQDESKNPKELYQINNKLRNKYKDYDELQIQYFESLIDEIPYKEDTINDRLHAVSVFDESEYVYSTSNELIFSSNNNIEKLIIVEDSIHSFNYNFGNDIGIVKTKSNSLHIVNSPQYFVLNKISDSITGINVLDDRIAIILNYQKILILI